MVRNPRTMMMCGMLVAAMGLSLGSQLAPTERGASAAPAPALLPWLVERFADRSPLDSGAAPATVPVAAAGASVAGLEGRREPRGPRLGRDARDRTPR